MTMLKRFAIGVLFLLGVILVLGAFAPREMNVSRTIVIDASKADVFEAIYELKNWEHWSPWMKKDTTIKTTYSDQSFGNGAYYKWTSENSGAGQMTIIETFKDDSMHMELEFDGRGVAPVKFFLMPKEEGISTTWTFHSDVPYPFNAMLLFQNPEEMLGKDYEEGLGLLKTYVEANKSPEYEVKAIQFPATRYLAQKATVKMVDLGEHFKTTMPAVATAFLENKVKMAGPASGLFYTWDEENQSSDLAIGIPAAPDAEIDGLSAIDIPASRAFQIDYYGPYEGTGAAHGTMAVFLAKENLEASSSLAIERYITDPTTEPDPTKWLTEVIYLVE